MNFRMGMIKACPDFLESVPRSAMIAAIRSHATAQDARGPIATTHDHEGLAFSLETDADRTATVIRLEVSCSTC